MARLSKEKIEERERLAELGLKQCAKKAGCGLVKPLDDFGPNKGKWDNKNAICHVCNRERSKRYRKENPEASRASVQQYYQRNLEARLEYRRKHDVKKKQEDPMYIRLNDGKARAKRVGAEWETIKSTDLLNYWEQNNMSIDTCYYCNNHIELDELEIDHGIPLIKGGTHTVDNLYPSHNRCNREKNNKTIEEYMNYLMQAV